MKTYTMIFNADTMQVLNAARKTWEAYDPARHADFAIEAPEVPIMEPGVIAPIAEPPAKDAPSALDDAKDQAEDRPSTGGAEPPKEGGCRECKRIRRLNRLKLCYPCFAELVLMEEAKKRGHSWKPGDKHPDFCSCEGLGEHPERDRGAWRGN